MARAKAAATETETTETTVDVDEGTKGIHFGEEKPAVADPEPAPRPYHEAITEEQRELLGPNAPRAEESAEEAAAG